MEKSIALKKGDITFSIWDLGGQQEFSHMLPLVCNEAQCILYLFDLSRKSTLASVKQWYKESRKLNKTAVPFLIGTKYDSFASLDAKEQSQITKQARKFAKAMKAPLIFCSSAEGINVKAIFKIVLCKMFKLKCNVKPITQDGEPIIEYTI
jgi:GTP-binding protein of the ras superfamily involved in termination of M-phase